MIFRTATAAAALLIGTPALAQNSANPAPVPIPSPIPPAEKSQPRERPEPGGTTTPPPAIETSVPEPSEPAPRPAPSPSPQPAPMEPVPISPDAAYPEGFGDPVDPFGNDMSVDYRRQGGGFPWGLLGLLGLLGLIPLFRDRRGPSRTVYRDEDPPRRVRTDRVDEV